MAIYSKGKIAIPNVTGNIVINITAVPSVIPIENLVETYGVANGYRISTSAGTNSAQTGYCAVGASKDSAGIIPYEVGDVFRIKGAQWPSSQDTKLAMIFYKTASGEYPQTLATYLYPGVTDNVVDLAYDASTDIATLTIKKIANGTISGACPFARFSLKCSDTTKLIITKNQEIT